MERSSQDPGEQRHALSEDNRGRIYVLAPETVAGHRDDEIDLVELAYLLWDRKWMIVVAGVVCAIVAAAYSLIATEWYRAEVLMAPAEDNMTPNLVGQLGGLARLAGVQTSTGPRAEALAILQSRDFTRDFIEAQNLLPVLYAANWDEETESWKLDDKGKQPDMRAAVKLFGEHVRNVEEDPDTGMVTLRIEWTDPDVAAKWANLMVQQLNDRMRLRALKEAEANMEYLRDALSQTTIVSLQQSISGLLENELQKAMVARGNKEFSFRVIDRAEPPEYRSRPRRTLIVILAGMLGGIMGTFAVLIGHVFRREQARRGIGASSAE